MAEFYQGAGKDFDTAAFIVIGTGVGGALFQQGKLDQRRPSLRRRVWFDGS